MVELAAMSDLECAAMPRPEYPRPHRVRPRWMNLNGPWQFAFDDEDRGVRDGWFTGRDLPQRIVVPFTFEAPLSGIGDRSVHRVVWYRREVDIPADFLQQRLLLHIGACDFATRVWVNSHAAGTHRGGYTPIACEIQHWTRAGRNEIVIRAEDRPVWTQPRGKQIIGERPELIDYDRVTGIWQSVWLEPVPEVFIEDVWSTYDLDTQRLSIRVQTNTEFRGQVGITVSLGGAPVAHGQSSGRIDVSIPDPQLWSVERPTLYDITVALRLGDDVIDSVTTYAGLREFRCSGRSVLLNGEPFYFRGVLDQGYFPGGWYTAPSDAELRRDIELMKALGFNGARKHQKAEDPRWLYWADRLGFVVWSEMGNGREFSTTHVDDLTREWMDVVRRDRMHPSIMAWVPLNESWGVGRVATSRRQQEWVRALFHLTHAIDGTRPVLANDGWEYLAGDIWGVHLYVPDGPFLAEMLAAILSEPTRELIPGRRAALPGGAVDNVPVMLTEFGGLAFRDPTRPADAGSTWGYDTVTDAREFEHRLSALVGAVRSQSHFSGFVWTQLTDVQQEANGLLYFDRTPKLTLDAYRRMFGTRPT
jgi:beta-galactosidase/beta-glucuronidase